jgi:hypothetical protein
VNKDKIPSPRIEIAATAVQNKSILSDSGERAKREFSQAKNGEDER